MTNDCAMFLEKILFSKAQMNTKRVLQICLHLYDTRRLLALVILVAPLALIMPLLLKSINVFTAVIEITISTPFFLFLNI